MKIKLFALMLACMSATVQAQQQEKEPDLVQDTALGAVVGAAIGYVCGGWLCSIPSAAGQAYFVYDSESNTTPRDVYKHPTIDLDEFNARYNK